MLLIFNDISPEEKLGKGVHVSLNFYDKVSSIKKQLKIFDLGNNLTDDDDEFNIDDGFTKKWRLDQTRKKKNNCVPKNFWNSYEWRIWLSFYEKSKLLLFSCIKAQCTISEFFMKA